MLDPDIPPEAEDATGGVADVVPLIVVVVAQAEAAIARQPAESTPRPWTIAIAPR
jgi:hypothetical protein